MGSGHSRQLSQLWQLPLLVFSVFLFGYAAYLFIDPKPGPSVADLQAPHIPKDLRPGYIRFFFGADFVPQWRSQRRTLQERLDLLQEREWLKPSET